MKTRKMALAFDAKKKSYEYYHEGRTPAEDGELATKKETHYVRECGAKIVRYKEYPRAERDRVKAKELREWFQTIPADCMSLIARESVNAAEFAKDELASRGLDINGIWVGFKAARRQK